VTNKKLSSLRAKRGSPSTPASTVDGRAALAMTEFLDGENLCLL
jgi:hypothetical protein